MDIEKLWELVNVSSVLYQKSNLELLATAWFFLEPENISTLSKAEEYLLKMSVN
jgi:hypothetical protein